MFFFQLCNFIKGIKSFKERSSTECLSAAVGGKLFHIDSVSFLPNLLKQHFRKFNFSKKLLATSADTFSSSIVTFKCQLRELLRGNWFSTQQSNQTVAIILKLIFSWYLNENDFYKFYDISEWIDQIQMTKYTYKPNANFQHFHYFKCDVK